MTVRRRSALNAAGCLVALAGSGLLIHDLLFDQTRFAILAVADVVLTLIAAIGYVIFQNRRSPG